MHRYKGIFDYIEMNRWLNYEEIPIENYAKVGAKYEIITEEELEVTRGKNLVHIILESTENNFADNSLFPNLLPTIDNIKSKSVLFDNMDMCENATLTFGGMYAAYTGKWLSSVFGYGNKYNLKYNSIMSFPQILQKAKYNQVFTYAHINAFSGFKEYLQYIGFDVHQYAIESIKGISEMYKSDTFLFQKAYEDFEKLASKDNPFNLTILTIDAHAPDGLTYKDTKKYIGGQKNKLLDAIHTTDNALGDFLEKIKKHKSYKDTIIVIQSDHLAHPFTTKDILQKLQEKDRKMLFLIANTDFRSEVNHSASKTFDIAPTILEAMKVKHNAVFLFGENLFNEKQTPNRLKYNVDQERINLDYDKRVSKM